jgi:hypothetical protein
MDLRGDDLESAVYVVGRFIDGLRAGAPPVPRQVTDWCLKVRLAWETSADGHENDDVAEQLDQELIDVTESAFILNRSPRQVRRLVNDLDGRKRGGVWLFPKTTVIDYAERRLPCPKAT